MQSSDVFNGHTEGLDLQTRVPNEPNPVNTAGKRNGNSFGSYPKDSVFDSHPCYQGRLLIMTIVLEGPQKTKRAR